MISAVAIAIIRIISILIPLELFVSVGEDDV